MSSEIVEEIINMIYICAKRERIFELIQICKDTNANIFGNFIRDSIAGIKPDDINIVVSELFFNKFKNKMFNNGYNIIKPLWEDDRYKFVCEDKLDVEVTLVNDISEQIIFDTFETPDFDINLLVFDVKQGKIYNYMNPDEDIRNIVKSIKNMRATYLRLLDNDLKLKDYKIKKLIDKGYILYNIF